MAREPLDTEKVTAAAAGLADRSGLDSVTLTAVAAELGVRQPALYRHVDSYDELIRLLGLRGRQVLTERLTKATIGVAGDEAVAALGHAWRQMVADHPGLYAATDRSPCGGDPELEDAVEAVLDVLAQALASYDLSDENRVHAARALRSAFHGFAHLESGDGHPEPENSDDTFDHIIDLLCAGIAHLED